MPWKRGGSGGPVRLQSTRSLVVSDCPGRALLLLRIIGPAEAQVYDSHGNRGVTLPAGTFILLDYKQGCEAPWEMSSAGTCDVSFSEIYDDRGKPFAGLWGI